MDSAQSFPVEPATTEKKKHKKHKKRIKHQYRTEKRSATPTTHSPSPLQVRPFVDAREKLAAACTQPFQRLSHTHKPPAKSRAHQSTNPHTHTCRHLPGCIPTCHHPDLPGLTHTSLRSKLVRATHFSHHTDLLRPPHTRHHADLPCPPHTRLHSNLRRPIRLSHHLPSHVTIDLHPRLSEPSLRTPLPPGPPTALSTFQATPGTTVCLFLVCLVTPEVIPLRALYVVPKGSRPWTLVA